MAKLCGDKKEERAGAQQEAEEALLNVVSNFLVRGLRVDEQRQAPAKQQQRLLLVAFVPFSKPAS